VDGSNLGRSRGGLGIGLALVATLAAGKAGEVIIRLPQSALRMSSADSKPTTFTHLFIAVDLMNTVAETDETNNTAIVEKEALESSAADLRIAVYRFKICLIKKLWSVVLNLISKTLV
jgi:hypothetical protein